MFGIAEEEAVLNVMADAHHTTSQRQRDGEIERQRDGEIERQRDREIEISAIFVAHLHCSALISFRG